MLRLLRFRAVGAGYDAALRDLLVPEFDAVPGMKALVAGRMGPGQEGERILATAWASAEAMERAIDAGSGSIVRRAEALHGTLAEPPEVLSVAVEVEPLAAPGISIIRVVAGITRTDELDAYVADASAGVAHDRAAGEGPLALFLCVEPPDRFVTLSLWGGWSHVEAATGADHEHVERTRHTERLATWTAEHYEVIPGLAFLPAAAGENLPGS